MYRLPCIIKLGTNFNEVEQSAAELLRFTMSYMGADRHLEFDLNWIFTMFRGLTHNAPACQILIFNTVGQFAAKLFVI